MNFDGDITISVGESRKSVNWKKHKMLWSDFVKKFKETKRTPETVEQYLKMDKPEQDEIKDVGGFVGGTFLGNKRKYISLESRSLITLDIDFAHSELWEDFALICNCSAFLYSTHKHTEKEPRLRLVLPLKREITREEYEPVARYIANLLSMDFFDDTTFEPSRLMYFASSSIDAEYVFRSQDGDWLNPDIILKAYANWRDASQWFVSSRVGKARQRQMQKLGEPTEKKGLIGAFCNCFSISEAISNFLQAEYTETNEANRYSYSSGSTSGGLVVYDDKFAYSHHGTDPISGKLCNAFDLVRIHKFRDDDLSAKEDTPINRLPSYKLMEQFCVENSQVKKYMVKERIKEASEDFKDFEIPEEENDTWIEELVVDSKGRPLNITNNMLIILKKDPFFKGTFAFDEFEKSPIAKRHLPWRTVSENTRYLTDSDDSQIRNYLEKIYNLKSVQKVSDALSIALSDNAFHPVRDYLDALIWDGAERLDTLFIDYLGAEDTKLTRAVTRKTLTAAVARVFNPGCKFDYMLTLYGKQGIGKSSIIKLLGGKWYSDSLGNVSSKDTFEQLQGVWLVELGELASLKKAETEQIKHFITKATDRFRVSYGKRPENYPRQCIFFGTTNTEQFLKDQTGNRRFWVLDTDKDNATKDLFKDFTKSEIDQVWAEALSAYKSGETLHLKTELENRAKEKQEEHIAHNELEGLLKDFLDIEIPPTWEKMNNFERHNYINNSSERDRYAEKELAQRNKTCVMEIWVEMLGGFPKDLNRAKSNEIVAALNRIEDWENTKKTINFKFYGAQRGFLRKN